MIFGQRVGGGDWFDQHRSEAEELLQQLVAQSALVEIEARQQRKAELLRSLGLNEDGRPLKASRKRKPGQRRPPS